MGYSPTELENEYRKSFEFVINRKYTKEELKCFVSMALVTHKFPNKVMITYPVSKLSCVDGKLYLFKNPINNWEYYQGRNGFMVNRELFSDPKEAFKYVIKQMYYIYQDETLAFFDKCMEYPFEDDVLNGFNDVMQSYFDNKNINENVIKEQKLLLKQSLLK